MLYVYLLCLSTVIATKIHEPLLFNQYKGDVFDLAIAPDGNTVATVGGALFKQGELAIWHLDTAKQLTFVRFKRGRIWSVCYSPDGKMLAIGGEDGQLSIIDAQSGKILREFEGHRAVVNSVGFSADCSRLISAASDDSVRTWNVKTGMPLVTIAYNSKTDIVKDLWKRYPEQPAERAQKVIKVEQTVVGAGTLLAVTSDHSGVAIAKRVGVIELRDFADCKVTKEYALPEKFVSTGVKCSDTGCLAINSGHDDSRLLIFSLNSKEKLTLDVKDGVADFCFVPNSNKIITASKTGKLSIWNTQTGKCEQVINLDEDDIVRGLTVTPDGKLLLGVIQRRIRIWDLATGKERK